jgi:galactoside O-acetyltransferase
VTNQLKHIGKDVIIRRWVRFVRPEHIHIGDHVMIDDFVLLSGGRDELTEIGNYVHVACFSSIIGSGGVTMKDFSGLSPGCRLFSETDDYVDGGLINPTVPLEFRRPRVGRITLERFVTLGANCVVLPGVTLGEGATVGACSLVTGDLEPWTVNVGIPAKPIKKRNRDEVVRRAEMVLKREL